MSPYFFGNGCCWILAKKAGNVLKGFSLVQFVFDIDTVFKGKVLLVSGIYLLMDILLSTAVRKKDNLTIFI